MEKMKKSKVENSLDSSEIIRKLKMKQFRKLVGVKIEDHEHSSDLSFRRNPLRRLHMIFSMKTMYKLYKEVLVVGDFINYFLQLAYF